MRRVLQAGGQRLALALRSASGRHRTPGTECSGRAAAAHLSLPIHRLFGRTGRQAFCTAISTAFGNYCSKLFHGASAVACAQGRRLALGRGRVGLQGLCGPCFAGQQRFHSPAFFSGTHFAHLWVVLKKASALRTSGSHPRGEKYMTASNSTDSQAISRSAYRGASRAAGATAQPSASTGGRTAADKTSGVRSALQDDRKPARRGFAAMDPARQREIAAQGGRAAHESGNAHQFTVEEARAAGKKSHSTRQQRAALRLSV